MEEKKIVKKNEELVQTSIPLLLSLPLTYNKEPSKVAQLCLDLDSPPSLA